MGGGGSPQSACAALSSNLSPQHLLFLKQAASFPGFSTTTSSSITPSGQTFNSNGSVGGGMGTCSNGSTPTLMSYPGPSSSYSGTPTAAYAHLLDGISPSPLDDAAGSLCGGFRGLWVSPPHPLGSPPSLNPGGKGRSPNSAPQYPRRMTTTPGGGRLPGSRDSMVAAAVAAAGMVGQGCGGGRGGANDMEYQIDLEKIAKGLDKRTTIMIRNIPNKYTQQLLLNEINVAHKGKVDFFYLPLDFKNRYGWMDGGVSFFLVVCLYEIVRNLAKINFDYADLSLQMQRRLCLYQLDGLPGTYIPLGPPPLSLAHVSSPQSH